MQTGEPPRGVVLPLNQDGSKNVKYVDLLTEDKPISGQKWGVFSFISPEKIIEDKHLFMFQHFVKQWPLNKTMEKFTKFLSFLAFKYGLDYEKLNIDLEEFAKTEKDNLFGDFTIDDEYKNFLDNNEEKLEAEFDKKHNFQTSVRGIKFRGAFETQEEANLRAQMLREFDNAEHDIHVGPVGVWLPFHPDAYKTQQVEYLEPELNQLMHEKRENERKAKDAFDQRVMETRKKAIADNEKKALESGNMLTQTLNESGELVSVDSRNTIESNILANTGGEVSSADIRAELFEGDNIVTQSQMDSSAVQNGDQNEDGNE